MKRKLLYLALGFQILITHIWSELPRPVSCYKKKTFNEAESSQEDEFYLYFADILHDFQDFPTSLYLLNQLINKKETASCYDENYVQALHKAMELYSLINMNQAVELFEKIQIHDKKRPTFDVGFENGYMIIKNFSLDIKTKFAKEFLSDMYVTLGLCETKGDIEFSNEQIKIKMRCDGCQKPQSIKESTEIP